MITPAVVNGRVLVDGGVLNPVPVAATAPSHTDLVVAVSLQGQHSHRAATTPTHDSAEHRPAVEWWNRFRTNAAEVLSSETMEALTQRLASRRGTVIVDPATDESEPEPLPSIGMREVLALSLDAAQNALTRYALAAHTPDVLITVPRDACRTGDFHKAAELIDLGRELARHALDGTVGAS